MHVTSKVKQTVCCKQNEKEEQELFTTIVKEIYFVRDSGYENKSRY
jgi:hypothetical protein